ncbi:hypothetical protein KR059_007136 [Drosophila kikkawai]|nr:hypothetical protein KR059_007136 [Drosophila kikkawai]
MIKAYARCEDLQGGNAPKVFSMWHLCDTPAVYKDVDFITSADCHKLKRELDWEQRVPEVDYLVITVGVILAVASIFVLLLLLLCGLKWRPRTKTDCVGEHPVQQDGPTEIPLVKKKKKLNFTKWMRRSCRFCCLQSEAQVRRHELKTKKQVAVHKKRSQRKLDAWTKARELNAQRKKEKLERRKQKEYDQMHKDMQKY